MILEETIGAVKSATNVIRLTADLTDWAVAHPSQKPDQGWVANWKAGIQNFSKSAQNVLTYYRAPSWSILVTLPGSSGFGFDFVSLGSVGVTIGSGGISFGAAAG